MLDFSVCVRIVALSAVLLVTTGCLSIRGPRLPKAFVITDTRESLVVNEVQRYQDDKCLPDVKKDIDCPKNKAERDQIVFDLKLIIDSRYDDYVRSFQHTEDTTDFAGEVLAATLSGSAGVVGAVATKDILTLASTLVQSTSISSQKNFYQKQTSYAIITVMDSQRADKWASIYTQLQDKDIPDYSLSAALSDLYDYRRQGNAIQALASIQKNAGLTSAAADTRMKKASGVD